MNAKKSHEDEPKDVQNDKTEDIKHEKQTNISADNEEISMNNTTVSLGDSSENKKESLKVNKDSDLTLSLKAEINSLNNQLADYKDKLESYRIEMEHYKTELEDIRASRIEIIQKDKDEWGKKIEDKKSELNLLQKKVDDLNSAYIKKEKELTEKEKYIAEKEQEFVIREDEVKQGFPEQIQKAIEKGKKELDDLTIEKEKRIKELDILRTDTLKELDEFKERERKVFWESIEKEKNHLMEQIAEKSNALEEQRINLNAQIDEFEESKQAFEIERSKLERELQYKMDNLDADRLLFETKAESKVSAKIDSLEMQLDAEKNTTLNFKEEIRELRSEINALHEINFKFENKQPQEVLDELNSLKSEKQRLEEELYNRPSRDDLADLDRLKEEKLQAREEINSLREKIAELEQSSNSNIISVLELEALREQLNVSQNAMQRLKASIAELENELKKYTESPSATLEARIGVIEEPLDEFKDLRKAENNETNEINWLGKIFDKMELSGFTFNKRLVKAFHTSLKIAEWSPLTVLAGVSGTGKSELPRLYSRFGGIQFAPIAVQPNWDSSQDMFGFFNYMEQKFNPKPLLRAMAQSQRSADNGNGFDDGLLLVLLDEMNLARIEQYFSDLLSKLELRRGESDVNIGIDLGSGHQFLLNLGRNILYTGTMNEDESTMTLSDKVLDRSNVISFPSPKKFHQRDSFDLAEPEGFLTFETWRSWQRFPDSLPQTIRTKYKQVVEEMNAIIRIAGRAVGHRVWQGMENYIANHPDVCSFSDFEDTDFSNQYEAACQRAFEDQIVQKIMPKLRGLETEGGIKKDVIEPIRSLITEHSPGLQDDYDAAITRGHGIFYWHTAEYLLKSEEEDDTQSIEADEAPVENAE